MASPAIAIESIERRMRGGSQALLVRTTNQDMYVAKCLGNPQGDRTLINEWIVTRLLQSLNISAPEVHPLQLTDGVPGSNLLHFELGTHKIPIRLGLHLGSRCPVDPARVAIFDFLPRRLLSRVVNLPDFVFAYVFDHWVSQSDTRQAIFIREHRPDRQVAFRAYLIDHGFSFGGQRWELSDTALHGLYYDRAVYPESDMDSHCHAAVDKIQSLPEQLLSLAYHDVPTEWFANGDREQIMQLLQKLSSRRAKLHESVERALRALRQAGGVISKPHSGLLLTIFISLACLLRLHTYRRPVAEARITANRNIEFSEAPDNTPLHFTADAYDLNQPSMTAEVVDERGREIWLGPANLKKGRVETSLPPLHDSGVHFIRLYTTRKNGLKELLREYVLVIKPCSK